MTAPAGRMRTLVILAFVTVTLVWGSTWTVMRGQLGVVDPTWSVSYRFFIGGAALFAFCAARGISMRIGWPGLAFAAMLGSLQCWLNFVLIYHSEFYVTSGVVALLFSLQVTVNAVLGRIFVGLRVTRQFVLGALVSTIGMVLLFWHEFVSAIGGGGKVLLGLGLASLGLMSASISNVMQASARGRSLPPLQTLGWGMVIAAALNALTAAVTVGPPNFDPHFVYVGGLLYLALSSSVTFPLFYFLINQIGPSRAAYSSVAVPILAMTLSTILEGYRWSALAALGAALALVGLIVALRSKRAAVPAPGMPEVAQ